MSKEACVSVVVVVARSDIVGDGFAKADSGQSHLSFKAEA